MGSKRGGLGTPPFGHLGGPPGAWFGDPSQTSVSGPSRGGSGNLTFPGLDGPWDPGLGPSKPAQTVQKLTFCGFPGDPRKTQKTGFYDSNFLIRPIACFSGGVPPKSHFFPKKSLFRGSPQTTVWDRFGTGLGPVWDRFGTPPHPPSPGGEKGGKSEVWKGPKN